MRTAVIAIGGNAILRRGQEASMENQMNNLRATCSSLVSMISNGYSLVLTHGNGPQVGNILLQNELVKRDVPAMPLDICVAESQGQIGYMLQQALTEALRRRGIDRSTVCVLTRTLVDESDPAFSSPSKPVGPYYSKDEARVMIATRRWTMEEDKKRSGYRRMIASPRPVQVLEAGVIRRFLKGEDGSMIVIAAGGGGIPMVRRRGQLFGIEAVIDKDLTAASLATSLDEKLLILLTDVDRAYLNFNSESPIPLARVTVEEMQAYYEQGHFLAGSMGPKVEAALQFLRNGGERAIITAPECLDKSLLSKAGTEIVLG